MKSNIFFALLLILLSCTSIFSQTFIDDTLIVRQVLDAAGDSSSSVMSRADTSNGRIDSLYMYQVDTLIDLVLNLDQLKALRIQDYYGKELPRNIGNLSNLERLHIERGKFTSLPSSISNLSACKYLDLSYCSDLNTVNSGIGSMTALVGLDLGQTAISTLPEVIGNLVNLRELNISNTNLAILPAEIGKCTALEKIYLNDSYLSTLPKEIGDLSNLNHLGLERNSITSIPASIGRLDNLTYLAAYGNALRSLPDSLGECDNLKSLYLQNNPLKALPDGICNLKKIERIDASQCSLSTLPDSIGRLKTLTSLNIQRNAITNLPQSIGNLDSLTTLDMERCNLVTLPNHISGLKSLEYLYLNYNNLTTMPDSIGNLSSLRYLYLDSNNISSLPYSFRNLSSLQSLKMNDNELVDGISAFSNLNSLKSLYVKRNRLQSIGFGVNLEELYAEDNQIDSLLLPGENKLKSLYLSNNKLSTLNWNRLSYLSTLIVLDLSYNELTEAFTVLRDGYFDNLKKVYLNNNNINSLGSNLSAFTKLDSLVLSYNSLDSIPDEITEVPLLKTLVLNHNPGIKITDSLMSVSNLNYLNIANCELDSLPSSVGNLGRNGRIWEMCIDSNNISSLPGTIAEANFWSLTWKNNNLTEIGDSIFMNPNLKYLILENNRLTDIPDGLEACTTLAGLFMTNNEIGELPEWIGSKTKLYSLDLSNNYISYLPDTIMNLVPSWFSIAGNKICDPFSLEMENWLKLYDRAWPNLFQDCDTPSNPITLNSNSLLNDKIELYWDTASVEHSDLEFSKILYSTNGFPSEAGDSTAYLLGKYNVFETFRDTLNGVLPNKRYYFSAFVSDSVDNWSSSAQTAQTIASTHNLSLYDSSGGNTSLVVGSADSLGAVSIYYKVYNSDSLDSLAVVNILYRNGESGQWVIADFITGEKDTVPSNDINIIRSASWSLKNQFGKDFVSDSLQIMITASAQFGLVDTLVMEQANLSVDFSEIPSSVSNLSAIPLSESEIQLSWKKSISLDIDSQFICFNTDGTYPLFKSSAEVIVGLGSNDTTYKLSSLFEKTWYYITLFAQDSAGNVSSLDSGSYISERTFDVTAPDDIKNPLIENLSYNSASFKWLSPDSLDVETYTLILSNSMITAVSDTFGNKWYSIPAEINTFAIDSLHPLTNYYLGAFSIDSAGNISTGKTLSFTTTEMGNIVPSVSLVEVLGEQSGDVGIKFTLTDINNDSLDVRFKYSIDGINWNNATVLGDVEDLSYDTYNGVVLNATWKSTEDLSDFDSDSVYFAAVPYDPANGTEDTVIIDLDNYHKQTAFLTTPTGTVSGDVKMILSVVDTSADSSSVSFFYSQNSGSSWQSAVNVSIAGDTVTWHSDSVFKNINVNGVVFKAVANDGWADGINGLTDTFSINNLTIHLSGDYNTDGYVDFLDFSYVATYWNLSATGITDPTSLNELAPYVGTAPYLTVTPDSLYNYEDLGAFIKMYYWSKENLDTSRVFANNRNEDIGYTNFSAESKNSTVTLKLKFKDLEDVVACRYRVSYSSNDLVLNSFSEGELLRRGGADILKVLDKRVGEVEVGLARISSGELSVDGDGEVSSINFELLNSEGVSFTVNYELINSRHEVFASGVEKIDLESIEEDAEIFSIVPSVSSSNPNVTEFSLIEDEYIADNLSLDNEGFIIRIDIPKEHFNSILSAKIIIFDMMGDIVSQYNCPEINEQVTFLKWNGCRHDGKALAQGTYIVVLRLNKDNGKDIMLKKFIGIKKEF